MSKPTMMASRRRTVRHKCVMIAASVIVTNTVFNCGALCADEFNTLPQAPSTATPTTAPSSTATPAPTPDAPAQAIAINSVIPPYIDQGIVMVPMRPLCDFLGAKISYNDSIITIARNGVRSITSSAGTTAAETDTIITLRAGGETAQLRNGTETKTVRLPLRAEERLGTTFLPLRFFAEAFGAEVAQTRSNAVVVRVGERTGVLQTDNVAAYTGRDAARVTFVNNVGRPLSLRLTGPQNMAIELGRRQSVTRSMRPGVYYYRAASTGMKTVKGARRLLAGRKATWAWGRR